MIDKVIQISEEAGEIIRDGLGKKFNCLMSPKYLMRLFFYFFVLITNTSLIFAQDNSQQRDSSVTKNLFVIHLKNFSFKSFGFNASNLPIKINQPVFENSVPFIEASLIIRKLNVEHSFSLGMIYPSKLKFDSGGGVNYFMDEEKSNFFVAEFNYQILFNLFEEGIISANYGAVGNIYFDTKKISYLNSGSSKSWDLSLFLGPVLLLKGKVTDQINVSFCWNALFTLPFMNIGNLYQEGVSNFPYESNYYTLGVKSSLNISASYFLNEQSFISFGYYRSGLISNGSRKQFDLSGSVNDKLYKINGFFLEYGLIF